MNQCIMPRKDVYQVSKAHMFQVRDPLTCTTEVKKVASLRALVREAEADLLKIESHNDRLEIYGTATLVAILVMETSVGFLDIAASAFDSINPAAAKIAKGGVFAVKSANTVGEVSTGKKSYSAAAGSIADGAVDLTTSMIKTDGIGQKIMLDKAKAAYDTAVIGIKSATGSSQQEIRQDGFDFAKDRLKTTGNVIADGVSQSGYKTAGSTLKGLMIVGDMYEAALRYQSSLDKQLDNHLISHEAAKQALMSSKMNLRNVLTLMRTKLNEAVSELEACDLQG